MGKRLVYLLVVLKPGDTETLERVMRELKRRNKKEGSDGHRNEPSCN